MNRPSVTCRSALSTSRELDEVLATVQSMVDESGPPSLAVAFLSADWAPQADELASRLCDTLGTEELVGCTGESIVGTGREVEGETAVSVWTARWEGEPPLAMRLDYEQTADGGAFVGWPDRLDDDAPASLLLLADPFSFPADVLLHSLNENRAGSVVLGGMASAGAAPGANRIIVGREVSSTGAAAVALPAEARLRTVVSQGCRPIGSPFVITKAERNLIQQLGGVSAIRRLEEVFNELPTRDRALVQKGLHVGRVVSEYLERFEQGDFLIRNVIGVDEESGGVAIGDYVRAGQTVQFHVRDEETADAEMRQMLAAVSETPSGALLFTCNGRGTRMFSQPHHDAGAIQSAFGDVPLAGFFAQGELGPIGDQNFMHGFTASMALIG